MAFLVARTAETRQVPRGELIALAVESFTRALDHHLAQIAGPMESYEAPPQYPAEMPDNELTRAFSEAVDASMRASRSMDITLVAYLRGAGQHELADKLTLGQVETVNNENWDLDYARRVLQAHEDGALSKPLALATVMATLLERMILESTSGAVLDPVRVDEGRKQHAEFFTRHGLLNSPRWCAKIPRPSWPQSKRARAT